MDAGPPQSQPRPVPRDSGLRRSEERGAGMAKGGRRITRQSRRAWRKGGRCGRPSGGSIVRRKTETDSVPHPSFPPSETFA